MHENNSNYFAMRDQYLLISYQDVIKQTYAKMLEIIVKDYFDDLNEILYLDKLKEFTEMDYQRLCVERLHKNPLRFLARKREYYDVCDKLLETFEDEMIEIYTDTELTQFGAKIYGISFQPFVKKIYIHTERPVYQMVYDCSVLFKTIESKIEYVSGDIIEILDVINPKPTCFIMNDMDIIKQIIDSKYIEFTEILFAEQGFNFALTKNNELMIKHNPEPLMKERLFKIGTLPLFDLEKYSVGGNSNENNNTEANNPDKL